MRSSIKILASIVFLASIAVVTAFSSSPRAVPRAAGVEVRGSVKRFCRALEKEGFVKDHEEDGVYVYRGPYLGREDTFVLAVADASGRDLCAAAVFVRGGGDWDTVNRMYSDMVRYCTEDYGAPYESVTTFSREGDLDGNMRMAGVVSGEADYHALWDVGEDRVSVSLEPMNGWIYVACRVVCGGAANKERNKGK